jgi:SdpI/YfhL protein family
MNGYLILSVVMTLCFFSLGLKLNKSASSMEGVLGYNTKASKRNEDTWFESNIYAGKCLMVLASLILLLLVITEIYFSTSTIAHKLFYILSGFVLTSLAIIYVLTERHLKRVFFRDGKRRPKF